MNPDELDVYVWKAKVIAFYRISLIFIECHWIVNSNELNVCVFSLHFIELSLDSEPR